MNITYRTELKTIAEVKAELQQRNAYVNAWYDAFTWLEEVTKDKRDKKATKAILTKWTTQYTSGHREERDLGDGVGWEIYMGTSPYDDNCNMIWLNACDVEYYSNGDKYLKPARNFYTGQFEYPKGATWQEVIDAITKYTLPQKVTFTDDDLKDWHDRLTDIVRLLQFTEDLDWKHYKETNWQPSHVFIKQ